MKLYCERCGNLIAWPGTKDRHPIPVVCDPCDKEWAKQLKRTQRVDCHARSEAQKKREPF